MNILCADTFEYLKTMPSNMFDAIITDIPYNIGIASWDKMKQPEIFEALFSEFDRITKSDANIVLMTGRQQAWSFMPLLTALWEERRVVIWKQSRNMNTSRGKALRGQYEPIVFMKKGNPFFFVPKVKPTAKQLQRKEYREGGVLANGVSLGDLWEHIPALSHNHQERIKEHPTQKPIELGRQIAECVIDNIQVATVLDPFCGTGSLLLGIEKHSPQTIIFGIDNNIEYCDIANNRKWT